MEAPSVSRLSSVSPIHLHVEEETPVHVHVIGKGPSNLSTSAASIHRTASGASISSRPHSRTSRPSSSRSQHPSGSTVKTKPWIPPPGKATKPGSGQLGKSVAFDDAEDDENYGKVKKYESKIETLMSETGELRSQLDLEKVRGEARRSEEELHGARKVIQEQELEIQEFQRELDATSEENRKLREGIDRLKSEGDSSSMDRSETEGLLKKLVEVEMDAGEALTQVNQLKDFVARLRDDKKMTCGESAELAEKRSGLVAKLEDFEAANRQLRNLLQSQHRAQVGVEQETEQRQMLLRKLTEVDSICQQQQKHIDEKSKLLTEATRALEAAQDQNKALLSLQTSLEQTRGHLQREVHKKRRRN